MDIVERLRDGVNRHYGKDPAGLLHEAADEIERLREDCKTLHILTGYAADLIKDGFYKDALAVLENAYSAALKGDE